MSMRFCLWLSLGLFAVSGEAAAQAYEGSACVTEGNARLRSLKAGAPVKDLGFSTGLTGAFSLWATSTLLPTGKVPKCKDCPPETEDDLQEREQFHDEWTCTYSAQRLGDGRPETAWCEGAKGPGTGEVVVARIQPEQPVFIWAGFGKSAKLHAGNARPRKVRLTILEEHHVEAFEPGESYSGLVAVASGEAELKDLNGYQPLKLPDYKPSPYSPEGGSPAPTFLAIEVVSVYPGATYHDLCISEVRSSAAP